MNCLKCGREVSGSQVFCNGCLDVMAQYPVKAGVAVHLPQRTAPVVKKRPPSPEELLAKAQRDNKRLRRWIALLCVMMVLGALLVTLYKFRTPIIENIGRNYTTYIGKDDTN